MKRVTLPAAMLLAIVACEPTTTAPPAAPSGPNGAFGSATGRAPVRLGKPTTPPASAVINGPIDAVDPTTLTTTQTIGFDEFEPGAGEGLNFDEVVDVDGAAFAEKFSGQTRSTRFVETAQFDTLHGVATNPLSLQAGAANQNLNVLFWAPTESNVIDGLGPTGFPNNNALGEGSIAVLFDADQFEVGFDIVGADGGGARVSFFRRDGSLIAGVALELLAEDASQSVAFRRAGNVRDIAGFSIHNDDEGGIGYDNFRIGSTATESSVLIEANTAATVTLEEECTADLDERCAVAGVDIPANGFAEDVIVTVRSVELNVGQQCHDFLVGQLGICVQITAQQADGGGDAVLLQPAVVGFCLPEDVLLPEVFKFEDRRGKAVPLRKAPALFLNCTDFQLSSTEPPNVLERFVKSVGRWLAPKPLMAADRGFGGIVPPDLDGGGFSFFTWAAPIQIAAAGVAINVFGRDAFSVIGTFNQTSTPPAALTFDPTVHAVTVAFGKFETTIPGSSFRLRFGRYVYTPPLGTKTGLLYMEIFPAGKFVLAGATTNTGLAHGTATFNGFTVQIGHHDAATNPSHHARVQGATLVCSALGICRLHVN